MIMQRESAPSAPPVYQDVYGFPEVPTSAPTAPLVGSPATTMEQPAEVKVAEAEAELDAPPAYEALGQQMGRPHNVLAPEAPAAAAAAASAPPPPPLTDFEVAQILSVDADPPAAGPWMMQGAGFDEASQSSDYMAPGAAYRSQNPRLGMTTSGGLTFSPAPPPTASAVTSVVEPEIPIIEDRDPVYVPPTGQQVQTLQPAAPSAPAAVPVSEQQATDIAALPVAAAVTADDVAADERRQAMTADHPILSTQRARRQDLRNQQEYITNLSNTEAESRIVNTRAREAPLRNAFYRGAEELMADTEIGETLFGSRSQMTRQSPRRRQTDWTVTPRHQGLEILDYECRIGRVNIGRCASEIAAYEHCTALAPPVWTEDSAANKCALCDATFAVLRRKHHCRNCGAAICDTCSKARWPKWALPPLFTEGQFGSKHRVCNSCDENSQSFRLALLEGDRARTLSIYEAGNVNLRTPFANDAEQSCPIHCAAQGGSVELLFWLVVEKHVPTLVTTRGKMGPAGIAAKYLKVQALAWLVNVAGCSLSDVSQPDTLRNALVASLHAMEPQIDSRFLLGTDGRNAVAADAGYAQLAANMTRMGHQTLTPSAPGLEPYPLTPGDTTRDTTATAVSDPGDLGPAALVAEAHPTPATAQAQVYLPSGGGFASAPAVATAVVDDGSGGSPYYQQQGSASTVSWSTTGAQFSATPM